MRRTVYLCLAALNVLVALICLGRAASTFERLGTSTVAAAAQNDPTIGARPAPRAALGGITQYASAPLFQKDRRFPVRGAVTQSVVAAPQAPPQPVGTVISNFGDKWALVLDPQTQLPTKVALSGEIAGWRIETISEKSVVFTRENETIEVKVRR